MLEGLAFEFLGQQAFNLGQVEERHLDLVALLHLAEDALQALHVVLVDESALAVAQRDVFLLVILLQERTERHFLTLDVDGGRPFKEVDARRQFEVHLRHDGLHLIVLQPFGTEQLVVAH